MSIVFIFLLAFAHAYERHEYAHAHASRHHVLSARALFDGFQVVQPGSLEGLGLGTACEQILYRPLKCDNYIARFSTPKYRPSLAGKALTLLVCDPACERALALFSRQVNFASKANKEVYPDV